MRNSLSVAVVAKVITNLLAVATAFISLRLYNIYLSKEIYGTVLVATQFMAYLPLISGGFGMVAGQQMLASRDRELFARLARYVQVLQSHVLVLAFVGSAILMAVYSQTPSARTVGLPLALYFAIAMAGTMTIYAGGQIGMMTALGRQIYMIGLTGIWSLLGLLILGVSFLLGFGVWAMPISTGLGAAVCVPAAWYIQQRLLPGIPHLIWERDSDFWSRFKTSWRPALTWLQTQFSIMFLYTMDIILMGMLFGPGPATVYGIVARVTAMARQVIQTLSDTAWPRFTQEHDPVRKADLMRKVDRLSAWLSGSWYGAMAATLHPFLGWLMKADWVAGSLLIYLVLARNLVTSLSSAHSYGLLGAGRFKEIAQGVQMEIIACLVTIFLFGHFLGSIGLPLGLLVGCCCVSSWYMTFRYFQTSHQASWKQEWCAIYVRGIGSALLGFAIATLVWWGEKALGAPGWMAVLAGGCGLAGGMGTAMLIGLARSGGQTQSLGPFKIPTRW